MKVEEIQALVRVAAVLLTAIGALIVAAALLHLHNVMAADRVFDQKCD